MKWATVAQAILTSLVLCAGQPVFASGLIWSLPEDGSWVRFEGSYKQQKVVEEGTDGNLEIEWIRHLIIKSVGRETAEYNGKSQPCRWIEVKAITGKRSEAGIDPGPVGARIYKVLVPESKILGKTKDADGIPVSMLPIIRGHRRFGEGKEQKITAKAIQINPTVTLLSHYKAMETVAERTSANVPAGAFEAKRVTATSNMERATSRSTNKAELWLSDEVPFGLVQWSVTVEREVKDLTDPREYDADHPERKSFRPTSKVTVKMSAHEIGDGAQSELQGQ